MIRRVIQADSQIINFQIPDNYVGKKIEVIVFALDEADEQQEEDPTNTHLASEATLARDWLHSGEDNAWNNL